MQSQATSETLESALTEEPVSQQYPDTMEGKLQHIADTSLFYQVQIKLAKTSLKKEYFTRKLKKNNNKLYRFLVQTPNAYNPLMKYLQPTKADSDAVEYDKDGNEINRVGYSHVDDSAFVEAVDSDIRFFEAKETEAIAAGDLAEAEKAGKQAALLRDAVKIYDKHHNAEGDA